MQILSAQEDSETYVDPVDIQLTESSKHSMLFELAGRGFIFGSLNYEYALSKSFSLGAGLGVAVIQSGQITRDNNGVPEEGRFLDSSTTQMIYGTYFLGKGKHQFLMTAGFTNFLATNRNKYPSETERSKESFGKWNAGLGYQFMRGKKFFRITGYCLSFVDVSEFFPAYLPWLGISFGLKLK